MCAVVAFVLKETLSILGVLRMSLSAHELKMLNVSVWNDHNPQLTTKSS